MTVVVVVVAAMVGVVRVAVVVGVVAISGSVCRRRRGALLTLTLTRFQLI